MATTKIFEELYSVVCNAHNIGNKKAISKEDCLSFGIDNRIFVLWQNANEKLREATFDYVAMVRNSIVPGSTITDKDIAAAREKIFPLWKELLACNKSTSAKLHVREYDIEALIKFCWKFTAFNEYYMCGTVVAPTAKNEFRRQVEALIGCNIAANEVLTLDEHDVIDAYTKAKKSYDNCVDAIDEAEKKIKVLEDRLKEAQDAGEELYCKYLNGDIAKLKEEIKAKEELKTKVVKTYTDLEKSVNEITSKINRLPVR